jgi:hypothetical protein
MSVSILSDAERNLLRLVLDRIVPANGSLAGAGGLGVAEQIEAAAAGSIDLRRQLLEGLQAIEMSAWQRADSAFAELAANAQDATLAAVEQSAPAFFDLLVRLTYRGYYTHPAVVASLGVTQPAPQPIGFTLPPFDPSVLEPIRARGSIYRQVESNNE